MQRFEDHSHISVTDANKALPRRLGFRSNQEAVCRVFDLAAQHHAGVREGSPHQALSLRLTLSNIDPAFRQRLNLQLSTPLSITMPTAPCEMLSMTGSGRRGRRAADPPPAGADVEELLDPAYVALNPITWQEVEKTLKEVLRRNHEPAHGRPLRGLPTPPWL